MTGDTDNYEDGHDDDESCIHTINLYDDDNDDDDDDDVVVVVVVAVVVVVVVVVVVGYIHLLTPRHAKHKSWEINRISTTPRHIQRA